MTLNNLHFASQNLTTVENFSRTSRVYFLAVHIRTTTSSDPLSSSEDLGEPHTPTGDGSSGVLPPWPTSTTARPGGTNANAYFRTITYPLPRRAFPPASTTVDEGKQGSTTTSQHSSLEFPSGPKRTFAILRTHPGDNPWDRGIRNNLTDLLGYTVLDWLLPLRRSPFTAHKDARWEFAYGDVLDRIKVEAGLGDICDELDNSASSHSSGRRGKGKRRSRSSGNNGDFESVQMRSEWEGQSVHLPSIPASTTAAPAVRPGEDAGAYVEGRPGAEGSRFGFSIETDESMPPERRRRRKHRKRSSGRAV
jgi:palmitoyltransferase